jgi:hypothetical protein
VDLSIIFRRTQFDPGDNSDSKLATGAFGFRKPVHRVVIGERDYGQTGGTRLGDQRRWGHGPIGSRRMCVKISRSGGRPERGRSVAPAVFHDA